MKIIASMFLFSLLVTGCFNNNDESKFKLKCGDSNLLFQLDLNSNTVRFIGSTNTREGRLSVSEDFYKFIFPRTESGWEIHVDVNRHTSKYNWEHGTPPFGEINLDNVYSSGECTKHTSNSI